ncbi:bifunctional diaminohydroxyphosphoribosylaminopyrimidine deaminase/5-amino-6-(5-phosphoribosylamino)uracil reductase RibD [Candidatus Laterigemmans baculatus]|uniref:bifunctional diaminohydroxyphosphoribosylaminopyrimidine deaminase/5-amino-6-(5-phosphoribosylamino)uracil reductase RibD n=1 Tax=Candidatus Laterigemmans baculatus TaxID=2770505 RepID=UPI00193B8236|nr:bifunctional diaminohydroxyphosphoribosylaminopyrimidine deaminase/5-amino-6-(5-phosphoribosylamino)uracil reductase RibD [Candidatus Laterigemmans baculatus]
MPSDPDNPIDPIHPGEPTGSGDSPRKPPEAGSDEAWMHRAAELAMRGQGLVEPNPMVGCLIVRDGQVLGEGWHRRFGGPHAEREALAAAGERADLSGATWYVTLEPCCHYGKTPPCSGAVIASRPARVVVALRDPFPAVDGGGLEHIAAAGIPIELGVGEAEVANLCAPYLKRVRTGRPWVIAKWAMTLDGKIATSTGDSRWISSPESRRRVHELRGRVDAVIVGAGTVLADDPQLTTRPPGHRVATRIVVDRHGTLAPDTQLVRTARQCPVRLFVGPDADAARMAKLQEAGVDVVRCEANGRVKMVETMLSHCGAAGMTNVLVEGGSALLGALRDAGQIDEAQVFVSPKIVGGQKAITPVAGIGLSAMSQAHGWETQSIERVDDDVHIIVRKRSKSA